MLLSFLRIRKKSAASSTPAKLPHFRPQVEVLERRDLPSVYTPAQIRQAYGFNQVSLTGAGQTIAIVDAYAHPNIFADADTFDRTFGITPWISSSSFLTVATPQGMPAVDPSWAMEIALDVEWAHAIAPGARILLVEARDNSLGNLLSAVRYAASQPGVSVVSLSWGTYEFYGENYLDSYFTTPPGHQGVTFVASSGDYGSPPSYPAISPNVLSVGGTSLFLDSWGSYLGETGWSGSGGGFSLYENEPSYQLGWQYTGRRSNPDVAYNADPYTGYYVYCSIPYYGYAGWWQMGGTSAAAPQWAALVALANQGRVAAGKATLDGPTQTLPAIYALPSSYFHDIFSGSNGGYVAGWGYDQVTGRGSPIANLIIQGLINYGTSLSGSGNRSPNQWAYWPIFWRTSPHADLLSSVSPAPLLFPPLDLSSTNSSMSMPVSTSLPPLPVPVSFGPAATDKLLSIDNHVAWESTPPPLLTPPQQVGEHLLEEKTLLPASQSVVGAQAWGLYIAAEQSHAFEVYNKKFILTTMTGLVQAIATSTWVCAPMLSRALPLPPIEVSDWRTALATCFGRACISASRSGPIGQVRALPAESQRAVGRAVLTAVLIASWADNPSAPAKNTASVHRRQPLGN